MSVFKTFLDDGLAEKAQKVFDKYEIDVETAINLFLRKVVELGDTPYDMEIIGKTRALEALHSLQNDYAESGEPIPTLEEINETIAETRRQMLETIEKGNV